MRRTGLLLVSVLILAGCGDDPPAPAPKPVSLSVSVPADASTVDVEEVTVTGSVSPASSEVRVRGERAEVTGGTFSAAIALDEGANLVDVTASAPGRRPATTAVRVVRQVPVEIPALEGEPADTAVAALEKLRLRVERRRGGGLLDDLLPGELEVCALEPAPGTRVKPGSTVTVEVAKSC